MFMIYDHVLLHRYFVLNLFMIIILLHKVVEFHSHVLVVDAAVAWQEFFVSNLAK